MNEDRNPAHHASLDHEGSLAWAASVLDAEVRPDDSADHPQDHTDDASDPPGIHSRPSF